MDEAPATRDATAIAVSGAAPEPEDQLRADTYRVLGSLLAAAPDTDTLELFAGAPVAEDGDLLAVAWRLLATSAGRTTAQQVEDEFAALFIGIGRGELMPYASWYLTGFLMEQPLTVLRDDLARLGVALQEGVHEPEDHIGALCEVMAMLIADPERAADYATQRTFYTTHIGPYVARFWHDLEHAKTARFYRAVSQLGAAFTDLETKYFSLSD